MNRFFTLLLASGLILLSVANAQCPVINGAMVNSCGPSEGINEFVIFTTTAQAAVSNYKLNYGSNNPPSNSPSGVMSGQSATTKTGAGSVTAGSGCTLTEVTSPSTVIPSGSVVIFVPSDLDNNYDLSNLCNGGALYVVYIDRTDSPSSWNDLGTFANNANGSRYLQIVNGSNNCTSSVATFTNGWATNTDGNYVAWVSGSPVYLNGGCTVILTPVKLVSFAGSINNSVSKLVWQTANEFNTKSFNVQWSTDGVNFTTVGSLPSKGNESVANYAFSHATVSAYNYYRLQIEEVDGSYAYSTIVKLTNSPADKSFKTFLDDTRSNLIVTWTGNASPTADIMVYDKLGRLLIKKMVSSVNGYNTAYLDAKVLANGAYTVKLINNNKTLVNRFVKY